MAVNLRNSEGAPMSEDVGNKSVQGKLVAKTIQMAMFTMNKNAVWAGDNALRKVSYPLASIKFSVNRNLFRLEVGDPFKFTYAKYSISEMICRVVNIAEENLESENITITAMEDVFSVTSARGEVEEPIGQAVPLPDYDVTATIYQNVIESPYIVSGDNLAVISMAARVDGNELGYLVYISADDGVSYTLAKRVNYFNPYGTLVQEYPIDTYQIDDVYGMIVDFVNTDIALFDSLTRQNMLGIKNLAIIGDEIMSIQTITPVTTLRYSLTGIYRGRFDTKREAHDVGTGIFLANGEVLTPFSNEDILEGVTRKFKFVPFNMQKTGLIADSLVTELPILSRSRKPYDPINLEANGIRNNPTYSTDIVLSWAPRVRGTGAGFFSPLTTDSYPIWEGYFEVEVWVSAALVRTKTAIDELTWTYTEAMNVADNGALADTVLFKLKNYIPYEEWAQGDSDQIELTATKEV